VTIEVCTWAVMKPLVLALSLLCLPLCPARAGMAEARSAYEAADYPTAAREWQQPAERGDALAQTNLATLYARGLGVAQDYSLALKWWRLAAAQGAADAQYGLGQLYSRGAGVLPDDAEAAKWFELAAAQGHIGAQSNLGLLFLEGRGVSRDYKLAMQWLSPAAEGGDDVARVLLGTIYAEGHSVPQNYTEALKWFRLAAANGLALAQYALGEMYSNGYGVDQSQSEAAKWFRLAADQGDENARQALDRLEQSVAPVPAPYPQHLRVRPPVAPSDIVEQANARFGIFATVPGNPYVLILDGDIGLNTPLELRRALRAQPEVRMLVLNSRGGLVSPALVVAYAVRDHGLDTYISGSSVCYSACSFIFFAGEQRIATGQLGVHQVWNKANDLILGQTILADVLEALRSFETNDTVIAQMMRTPPDELHVFGEGELAHLSINKGDPLRNVAQACAAHQGCEWNP